ncbi:MAG: hypothetical protein WAM46_10115, partial [Flavobacterium sp.]
MKTSTSLRQNSSHFYIIGFLSFLLASCGSYQNTSYNDNDGVYGGSTRTYATNTTNTNNQYKDYFKSLQDDNQPTEIFTDVDSYGNYSDNDSTQTATTTAYPAWGSANSEVAVNVYSDPTWSMGFGIGFGYPYYGWGYGGGGYWGYPSYWGPGWGYPGWVYPGYWGGGYGYGYNNYSYSYGRRGSAAYYGGRNYASNRSYMTNRGYNTNRNYTSGRNYNTNRNSYTSNRQNGYSDFRRSSSASTRTYNSSSPNFTNRRGTTTQGQS